MGRCFADCPVFVLFADVSEIWADVLLGAIRFLSPEFVEKEVSGGGHYTE